MKKRILLAVVGTLIITLLAACSPAQAPEEPVQEPDEPEVTYKYNDGVYEAVSYASRGYAWVKITIASDEIVAIETAEFDNTGTQKDPDFYGGDRYTYFVESHEALSSQILAANDWDVEGFTGATSTSDKLKDATKRALDKALVDRPAGGVYYDGTFMGISDKTERGWGIALLTIKNDAIEAVELQGTAPNRDADGEPVLDPKGNPVFILKDDTYAYDPFLEATVAVAEAMVESQSTTVDIFTGATSSSNQWMQAADRAFEAAKR